MQRAKDKVKNRLLPVVFLCAQIAAIAQSAGPQTLRGHVPSVVDRLKPEGRLEAARELKLAIGLPLRDKEGLTNLLTRLYDTTSSEYHHFLTPAQFAERFAPTDEDYKAVAAFARTNGLTVTGTYSNRALLDVSGTVANIEKAFHIALRTYRHPLENREFFAPDVEPSPDLATPVLHISGLDNYVEPRPMNLRKTRQAGVAANAIASGSGPQGTYMGNDFRAAYLPGVPLLGTGQTVGLVEFDGYYPGDISAYASLAGLPAVPLTNVYLDGINGTPGQNNLEVALDIDMAICMAPGLSSVIVYEGQIADDLLNRIATDGMARQVSASWTYAVSPQTEQIFQQCAAQGQSFFNAAGDSDAWIGKIITPCDDPNITIVGGTTLTTSGPSGAWVSETVWNWDVEDGPAFDGQGTGGGISTVYAIPSWQSGVSMAANQGSTSFRNVPDVAITADNVFVVADDGQEWNVGGTSCAAPLWAGFIAVANQQAAVQGRPALGFINPALYALGLSANYTNCFHDITTGNNAWSVSPTLFYAVPGYDLCSGWGTPIGSNLVNLLALDSLQISPSTSWVSSGMVGGPLTPEFQSYALTNTGSTALTWVAATTTPWLSVPPNGGTLAPGQGGGTVVASVNATADNLLPGTYEGTIWFSNLTQGTAQSRAVSLAIIKPPLVLTQPSSLTVIGGTVAIFSAEAAGGLPLNCQWQLNGANVPLIQRVSVMQGTVAEGGNSYGFLTSTLTISNVAESDGGTYTLVASNAAGLAISSGAVLTVVPSGPTIVQQPASQTVLIGTTAQFAVAAEGTAPFSYQWQQNDTNLTDGGGISGSLSPTLTIAGASSASIGTYSVIVSNSLGTAISTGAVLTVQVAAPGEQTAQNGGFETGDFSLWTESGNSTNASVASNSIAVHSGTFGALLSAAGSLGYLSQIEPTVAGQNYLLSLWLDSADGIAPNEFQVAWNGTVIFDQTNLAAIGWTNLQFDVTATDTNTLLQFGFRDDNGFFGLDDIQVIPFVSATGPPIIATPPANQISVQGGNATFSVLSSGDLPLLYQWLFDSVSIDGATNATLALTNLNTIQSGSYSVVVSNSAGSATSSDAVLTVLTGSQELITFDDLPYRLQPVPASYDNLTWSNFYYLNGVVGRTSGYTAGMISTPKVAYNGNGAPASISAAGPFVLYSGYVTAAWDDNLQLEVQGFNGQTLTYDTTYTLSATNATLIELNYVGVTSVQFITSGGVHHRGYNGAGSEFVLDNVSAFVAPIPPTPPPASIAVLYSFDGFDGGLPAAALAQGADGSFYGTTQYGGTSGDGTAFRITTNGALTTLFSFNSTNGAYPQAALLQGSDGNFYGTTQHGGTNDYGTVFRLATNGMFTSLASFDYYGTGGYPTAALTQGADGNFYGVTPTGGAFGVGTVFCMTTNGTLNTLASFDTTNGAAPEGALALGPDGNLYGTTYLGGTYDTGTVFSISTNGALTTIFSLDGLNAYPRGALVLASDGNFYGTTEYGGTNDYGTVFSVTTNGVLSTLASLNYVLTGGNPASGLIQAADGTFYGTTSTGGTFGTTYYNGTYGGGTVFNITTNGTLTTLVAFQNTNGIFPQAGLVQGLDGYFYGTAPYGGLGFNGYYNSGDGVIFRLGPTPATAASAIIAQPASQIVPVGGAPLFSVNATGANPISYAWERNGSPIAGATQSTYMTNGVQLTDSGAVFSCVISNAFGLVTSSNAALTVFSTSGVLYSFNGPEGGYPCAALIQGTDGNFYGTTQYGGLYGNGTVFSMTTNGIQSTLFSFDFYVNGANPLGALLQASDGNFYGTTTYGGIHDGGTIFRMTTNGAVTVLHSFNVSDGAEPCGALAQAADGSFYGTTLSGGSSDYGTVFRMTTNGALTTLFSFDYSDGAYPQSALVQGIDGSFYGTATSGGAGYQGTLFKVTTNGVLTTLVSFDNSNGAYPQGTLALGVDGSLYGTTVYGGTNDYGTVFSLTTGGTLTTLLWFQGSNGSNPQGGLIQGSDGNFYGTTAQGGPFGNGTVFTLATNDAATNLYSFNGTNGSYPGAALIQASDGNFYGTTDFGATGFDGVTWSGNGAVFRLAPPVAPVPPLVVTQPASETVFAGGTASFSMAAGGSIPLKYFWRRNGTNIAGATVSSYFTNGVQLSDSGSVFSCVVGNPYGGTITSNATLTVVAGTPGLITFDDLLGTLSSVPPGYYDLAWSNFYYLNGAAYGESSGFAVGVVSTNNVAYNNNGAPAAIISSSPFNLVSAYLTAAWDDNLGVEAQGYNGATLAYDNTYTLSATNPTLIAFNYVGVTSVRFICSGGTPDSGYNAVGTEFVMDNVTILPTPASNMPVQAPMPKPMPMIVLHSFEGFDGGHPASSLAQGSDGSFYGMTEYGGDFQYGTVFKMTTNGDLSTLVSFNDIDGAYPQSALIQGIDGQLYGTTTEGGAFGKGTVFSMTTNGALTTLINFSGTDGAYPYGALAQGADGSFYGTTTEGGAYSDGTVFSLATNGTATTMHSFNGSDGAYPYGGLAQGADGIFYGTTEYGGTNDYGTVFSIDTNGGFSTLASLNYGVTGGYPSAALVLGADGRFYGTTEFGGTNGDGTVFSVTTNGAITTLISFENSNGAEPYGALVQGTDGFFYGTTEYGGINDSGTVFGITTNGILASLFSFGSTNGLYPQSGLIQAIDGFFYATAAFGGIGFNGYYDSGDGIVFRLGTVSTTMPPAIVAQPVSQIVPVDGAPYFSVNASGAAPLSYKWLRNGSPIAGATESAYSTNNVRLTDSGDQFSCVIGNSYGSAVSSNAALTVFGVTGALFSFNGLDGGYPSCALIQNNNGGFIGATTYGGEYGEGAVFSLTTNGLLTTLASFNITNGSQPGAALVQGGDGNFYGTTQNGGTYQYGTVFKMTPNGTLSTLVSFDGADGAEPSGALAQGADGSFYGTTVDGGSNELGTVFRMTTNGALATLVSFGGSNGSSPVGALVQGGDGAFYGTTEDGGSNGLGTVFSMTTNGVLTTLVSFTGANGGFPQGGLVQGSDGSFYGTTAEGGTFGDGTAFSITTNGTLNILASFEGSNGFYPQGGLIQGADGSFYGTTTQGGTYGDGTVFSLTTNGTVTSLFSFDGFNGSYPGATLTLGSDGNFYGTTTYGGVDYYGLNWSGNGVVFRLASTFAPTAPLIVTQPASQTVHAGGRAAFSVTAVSSTPLSYSWQINGTNIPGASLPIYATNGVQPSDSGAVFSCVVSNAYGSLASSNATLTVGAPSLVQNGGFELGSFTDWTTNGNFEDCAVTLSTAFVHSGLFGAELGSIGSLGYISQSLATTAGELYQISFWLNGDGQTPNEFSVSWNGGTLLDRQNLGNSPWISYQLDAAATTTNTVLTFGFRNDSSYFALDDIAVYPIGLAPPEIQAVTAIDGAINFSWSAALGQNFLVQYATNLPAANWITLTGPIAATNTAMTISEPIGASAQQFYRLVLQP